MIITIARQCGCGALHVGEILAQHYNIPLYTRESLKEMARQKGVLSEMDDFFDERPVDDLMFAISYDYADAAGKVHQKAIHMLADLIGQQDCIIIGRCGNYIFRDREDLVSVFLKGDETARIKNTMIEENMSAEEAMEFNHLMDERRVFYHRYYTGLIWGDAKDYDLCIDSCRLSAEDAAQIIESYIASVHLQLK